MTRHHTHHARPDAGFTLVELSIAAVISAITAGAVLGGAGVITAVVSAKRSE